MRGSSVPGEKHIQGNPLEFHLRMFAAALQEAGYRDRTMCSKLRLVADLGHWLKRTGQSFASHLEEHLLEAFVKHKQRMQQMHGGDSKTLQQFLIHLRKHGVVSDRKLIPDQSPLAGILGRYEQHLLLERKLGSATIFNYLSFARRFLIERFSKGPLLLNLIAAQTCASLKGKRVSPHVCRHSTAMDLLHHGVDRCVIALWLGHESPETTQIYLHADMRLKEKALSRTDPIGVKPARYHPDDKLLAFLESL